MSAVPILCLACRSVLKPEGKKGSEKNLACPSCGARYPVVDGIPRLVPDLAPPIKDVRKGYNLQWERARQDSEFTHFNPLFRKNIGDYVSWDTMIDKKWFKGKKVLDAGCGSGRWSYALASLGADVTSVDFNDFSVRSARIEQKKFKNWRIVQADLTRLPFPPESFDLVFSWGVLHHTQSTKRAFDALAPLVKKGGLFYVMLYEKHNPVKIFNTELLRGLLLHMSDDARYAFSKAMAKIAKYDVLRYALKPFIDFSVNAEGTYDTYSVPIAHHHSAREVFGWFKDSGFGDITINASRTFTGPMAFFRGPYGGTVRMRGKKLGKYDGKPLAEAKVPDWELDFYKKFYKGETP